MFVYIHIYIYMYIYMCIVARFRGDASNFHSAGLRRACGDSRGDTSGARLACTEIGFDEATVAV
jgi:hypothetical protein